MARGNYDGAIGQFTSAGSAQGPNRYAYMGGNPETATDPTGKRECDYSDSCHIVKPTGGTGSSSATATSFMVGPVNGNRALALSLDLMRQINQVFHTDATRQVLYLLAETEIGKEFLAYILSMGIAVGILRSSGDSFITWHDLGSGEGGYTTAGGAIYLNSKLSLIDQAAALVHEAVESYFAVVGGWRSQATPHMDYVAEWFAGEYLFQLNQLHHGAAMPNNASNGEPINSLYGAYHLTYDDWKDTTDYQGYRSEPSVQAGFLPNAYWDSSTLGIPDIIWVTGLPNPMGLTDDMLSSSSVAPIQ